MLKNKLGNLEKYGCSREGGTHCSMSFWSSCKNFFTGKIYELGSAEQCTEALNNLQKEIADLNEHRFDLTILSEKYSSNIECLHQFE